MQSKRAKPKKQAKKPRRVVLGVGHPWFSCVGTAIQLMTADTFEAQTLALNYRDLGRYNRIRLVAEVLK